MRSKRPELRAALVLAAGLLIATTACAQELLTNPGFEEIGDKGLPSGWSRYCGGIPEEVMEVSQDAHSGQHAVRLIDTGPEVRDGKYCVGVIQDIKAEAGKLYKASVWAKALARNNDGALNMQMRFLPSGELKQVQLNPPVGGDWARFSVMGQAPEGTTTLRLYLYTMHYWTTDSLVDDASVKGVEVREGSIMGPLLAKGSGGIEEVRKLNLQTPIVQNGKAAARILVPAGEAYQALGERLAKAIEAKTGGKVPLTSDYGGTVESAETVIALGSLNNNRMVERLYLNNYLQIDALKPGPRWYVLQTVHEPYNGPKGKNVVVIGAGDDAGLAAGVDDFISRLGEGPDIVLQQPVLFVSGYNPMSEQQKADLLARQISQDALRDFWAAVERYRDTGDIAWAERAKKILLFCGERFVANPDYRVTWPEETTSSNIGAMWDVLEEAPVFSDAERLECTNIILMTLLELRGHCSGYGGLENNTTIIWNHTTFPLMGIYWMSRYFNRYYGDVDGQMELMLRKVHAAFEGQITSWKPQEDSLGYYSIVPRHTIEYTLAENDYRYFENGSVRKHADYTVGIADNTGDPGGFGDSGYGHGPYVNNINWALWYHKDGRYLWWLNKVLEHGYQNPYDQSIQPVEWPELAGVNVFELHPQVYEYTKDKSYYSGPLSPPNIPLEKAFDKIAFRENLDADGEYFMLDGYSRGKHLQYDGNAIIKYYADGHDWLIDGDYLVRNTTDHNMISIIRDGRCESLIPTCTALEAIGNLPSAGFTETAVYDYNGANWTRDIFWLKGEFTVVMDVLQAVEAGDYAFVGNWKTLAEGKQQLLDGRVFKTSRQAGGQIGSRGLIAVANPAEGIAKAVKFNDAYAQLDTAVELPAGKYALTVYALATSTGSDSLYLSIDGGDRKDFHVPIGQFGPSASSASKDTPTPNIEVLTDGLHRFNFTLREGPGVMLDRFVIQDMSGKVVKEIEAEDAPPLPKGQLKEAASADFYVKNDGWAQNGLAGRINHVGRKITYMRNRFGGQLGKGEPIALCNIFYNDTSDAPKDYDIARVDAQVAVVLKNGKPFAVFGSGDSVANPRFPGTKISAATRERYYLVGLTAADELFSADKPVAMELDFDAGTATIAAGPDTSITRVRGGAIKLKTGRATIDCNQWQGLAELRKETEQFFTEAMRNIEQPETEGQQAITAPKQMKADWSRPIALEKGEDEQPIFTIYPVDLDGDGNEEVIALRGRTATCLDAGGRQRWRFSTGGICRAVCAGDLDGDGTPELLLGSDDEHIYMLSAGGKELRKHHANIPLRVGTSSVREPKVANLAVGDLDGDGKLDIVACLLNANLLRYDLDFNLQWRFDRIPHGSREMTLVDLNRDGSLEILVANKYGGVQIFNAENRPQASVYSELGDVEMAYGNMDEDDDYEIANGSATGTFTCGQFAGTTEFTFNNYGFGAREVLMADVAGDQRDELLIGSETGYVYVVNGKGEATAQRNLGEVVTDLALLPGNGGKQLIAASLSNGGVYTLDGATKLLAGWRAHGEVVMVEGLRAGKNAKLLAATADTVTCLTP